jgi:hypothetical protein
VSYHTETGILGVRADEVAAVDCLLGHACDNLFERFDFNRPCLVHDRVDTFHDLIKFLDLVIAVSLREESLESI